MKYHLKLVKVQPFGSFLGL